MEGHGFVSEAGTIHKSKNENKNKDSLMKH